MKVGDILYVRNVYQNFGRNVEIVKIGRKYFYVNIRGEEVPFDINTRMQKPDKFGYGYTWVLYDSEESYKDIIEFNEKWRECTRRIDALSRSSKQKIIEICEAEYKQRYPRE